MVASLVTTPINWCYYTGHLGLGRRPRAKGLAQKLAIQMLETYSEPVLVEINAHSLFSKWFSEPGKLVGKLLERSKS